MFQKVVEIYLVNLPLFSSAKSRYLVSNLQSGYVEKLDGFMFPSAISRYLVSNCGTNLHNRVTNVNVSIRYIAVLGF